MKEKGEALNSTHKQTSTTKLKQLWKNLEDIPVYFDE
jgi:hypothetical protein